jgi:hypothetical protein
MNSLTGANTEYRARISRRQDNIAGQMDGLLGIERPADLKFHKQRSKELNWVRFRSA